MFLFSKSFSYLPSNMSLPSGVQWQMDLSGSRIFGIEGISSVCADLVLDQAAQGLIQPGLEHLRGQSIHNLSGQPVASTSPQSLFEKLTLNLSLPSLSLNSFPLVLSLSTPVKS